MTPGQRIQCRTNVIFGVAFTCAAAWLYFVLYAPMVARNADLVRTTCVVARPYGVELHYREDMCGDGFVVCARPTWRGYHALRYNTTNGAQIELKNNSVWAPGNLISKESAWDALKARKPLDFAFPCYYAAGDNVWTKKSDPSIILFLIVGVLFLAALSFYVAMQWRHAPQKQKRKKRNQGLKCV